MLQNRFLYWMDKVYGFFIKIGSNLQSLFLFYMRVTWGHQFFLAGSDKLKEISKTIDLFAALSIPNPEFHAYAVSFFESVGGILLIAGLASRLICIPLVGIMITALSTAHAEGLSSFKWVLDPKSLVLQDPYPFLITSLLVLIFGPGRLSIDAWIKRWVDHQPKY